MFSKLLWGNKQLLVVCEAARPALVARGQPRPGRPPGPCCCREAEASGRAGSRSPQGGGGGASSGCVMGLWLAWRLVRELFLLGCSWSGRR